MGTEKVRDNRKYLGMLMLTRIWSDHIRVSIFFFIALTPNPYKPLYEGNLR